MSEASVLKAILGVDVEDADGIVNLFSVGGGDDARQYLMVGDGLYKTMDHAMATKLGITVIRHCGVNELTMAMSGQEIHDLIDPVATSISGQGVMLAGPAEETARIVEKMVASGFGWVPTTLLAPKGSDAEPRHGRAESLVGFNVSAEIEELCGATSPAPKSSPVKSNLLAVMIRKTLDKMEADPDFQEMEAEDLTKAVASMMMQTIMLAVKHS